jgi:hypothetical protein
MHVSSDECVWSFRKKFRNWPANSGTVALAHIEGRLCRAKQGGKINYASNRGISDQGMTRKNDQQLALFVDKARTII